ncbi:hypothetical protein [Bacillus sp. JCM 19034]|uniref:UPF0738 family protein n=1 Tax=Bacillus sp. JCM 19034 TaxID=1481928 RepID=UPI000783345A|nr:hypothetical protein [Bacillus sp. JCM 19034]
MKKIYVTAVEVGEPTVVLIDEPIELSLAKDLNPGERMLVDSDQLEFLYILENEEGYYYLAFAKPIWESLNKLRKQEHRCIVHLHEKVKLELTKFVDELEYLVSNIEGNGNYGVEMEEAVRYMFLDNE